MSEEGNGKGELKVVRTFNGVLAVIVAGGLVGCVAQRPREARYSDPGAVVAGVPEQATMYDIEAAAQKLFDKMLAHPQFAKNYNAAKAAKGRDRLPVVCQGLFENKTTDPAMRSRLRAIDDTIRVRLFDTALFEVKDDESADAIKSRIVRSADGGIENASQLIKAFGEHDAPDFIVLGDLRHVSDKGDVHTYRLRLAIHNLHTGKLVWEGVQPWVKR